MSSRRTEVSVIVFAAAAALALFAIAGPVRSEDFEGETALVKRLTPPERLAYFGLRYLMNKYQARQYLSIESPDERTAWIDRFWIDLDPTPATEVNERRVEHEKRVELARSLFGMKKAPGWDKRGETLIRFGMPGYRARTFGDIGFYRMIPPGEVWYYESLDMLVDFQDFNLRGEFIYAIEPQGETGREMQDRLKLVIQNVTMHKMAYIPLTPQDISAIANFNPDRIDEVADQDVRMATPRDLIAGIEQEKLERSANNFYKYMKERPAIYSFELDADPLPFVFDVSAFRGGPDRLRTDVNVEVPTGELQFINRGDALASEVAVRVLVRDLAMEPVAAADDVIRISRDEAQTRIPSHVPGQLVFSLAPGYYRLGIEVTDVQSGRTGSLRTNVELVPPGASPEISDIEFASSITETEENTKFVKGNLRVVPHPLHAYRIPFPVTIYFEIYGLDTDAADLAYYEVEYRIVPLGKRRMGPVLVETPAAISSRFDATGFGPTQVQRLEIATDNLWNGAFELIVSVRDRRSLRSAERRANFSVIE